MSGPCVTPAAVTFEGGGFGASIGLVEATIEGHAAYLDSWLQVLRNDRTAIFTAARHAGEAFEYILAREMPLPDNAQCPVDY